MLRGDYPRVGGGGGGGAVVCRRGHQGGAGVAGAAGVGGDSSWLSPPPAPVRGVGRVPAVAARLAGGASRCERLRALEVTPVWWGRPAGVAAVSGPASAPAPPPAAHDKIARADGMMCSASWEGQLETDCVAPRLRLCAVDSNANRQHQFLGKIQIYSN